VPVPIALFLGQSNTPGRGVVQLTDDALGYQNPYAATQFMYQISGAPDDPPAFTLYGPGDMVPLAGGNEGIFGAWLPFAHELNGLGIAHAVAMMAIDSSFLHTHWKPTATFPTVGDNLFTLALEFAHNAETDLGGYIAWVFWNQWEADADNDPASSAYAVNLAALITAFRAEFPGVPWILQAASAATIPLGLDFAQRVIDAQIAVAAALPGVWLSSASGLTYGSGVHYDEPSLITIGGRYVDAIVTGSQSNGLRIGPRIGVRVGDVADAGRSLIANYPPVAAFSSIATGLSVAFTDASLDLEGPIASWAWTFGDGATSSSQSPTHVYAGAGTYTVTLTVTDADGATAQVAHDVSVVATLWTVDATSLKAAPADATEWTALVSDASLVVGAPEHLWLFQDASGNLAAAVGGKTLTMTGTPLYQQSETGWARKFIGSNTGVAAANRNAANATMSANTVSTMLLMYARIVNPVSGHQRMSYGGASSNAFEGIAGSNSVRYRTGGSAANGSVSHVGSVQPYVIVHDPSGTGRMGLFSPLERKTFDSGTSPAYAARSGSTVAFTFSLGTDATSNTIIGYGAGWSGATVQFADITAMEAAVRALLVGLGWTVAW